MKQQLTLMLLAFTLLATAHPDPGSPTRDYDNYHLGASRKNIVIMPDAAGKYLNNGTFLAPASIDKLALASRAVVAGMIFNLDEAVSRE